MAACAIILLWFVTAGVVADAKEPEAEFPAKTSREEIRPRLLTLRECLDIALENNRRRPVSRFDVEIADAQLRQALSSYWPQLGVKASYIRFDEDPNFIFPATNFSVPGSTIIVDTPLGPLPVTIPAQSINVPEQNIRMMDKQNMTGMLNLVYPLYTGGKRPAIVKQARSGLEAAKQEVRRTDLQVIFDVKRIYYGAVLAKKLRGIAADALARMEVTLDLTESLYKGRSTRVKKTDYLRNKTVVEGLRSTVAFLKGNERLSLAALTNAIGLDWDAEIDVSEVEIPYRPHEADLAKLVGNAYSFNPDWKKLEEGIKAREAQVEEKAAGHLPGLALVGNLTHIENSYDKGIVTPENKNSWSAGILLELPIFKGFRTKNEVREARARLEKIRHQKVLLREGIALQVKDVFLQMARSREQRKAMQEAVKSAEENRDLNERAYQEEMVETKDVIEAQLVESFMKANNEKTLYDHIESQAHLEFVVGKEIESNLQKIP
jgi:outer membrane protein TolC